MKHTVDEVISRDEDFVNVGLEIYEAHFVPNLSLCCHRHRSRILRKSQYFELRYWVSAYQHHLVPSLRTLSDLKLSEKWL